MWEDLTVALCGVGFAFVVAIVLVELPAVVNPRYRLQRHHRR